MKIASNVTFGNYNTIVAGAEIRTGVRLGNGNTILGGILGERVTLQNSNRVYPNAEVGSGTTIGSATSIFGTVGQNVEILDSVTIQEQATVGDSSFLGLACTVRHLAQLEDNVSLGRIADIGRSARIGAGSELGYEVCVEDGTVLPKGTQVEDRGMVSSDGKIFSAPAEVHRRFHYRNGNCIEGNR